MINIIIIMFFFKAKFNSSLNRERPFWVHEGKLDYRRIKSPPICFLVAIPIQAFRIIRLIIGD